MQDRLTTLDWAIIGIYVVFAIGLGAAFSKKASTSAQSFFVGDKNLSWWVAGTSIVATTFAADTPLAITGIVAAGGIAGNWLWWSWGLAHICATFFFARMWRRSGVITDAEITELRYAGKPAAGLRVFKAFYYGIFINCLTMAWVIAAMKKISLAFFPDVSVALVIALCVGISVLYTTLGGFRSVVFTDFAQFIMGMVGSVALAVVVLMHFGGMGALEGFADPIARGGLLEQVQTTVGQAGHSLKEVVAFIPDSDHPTTPFIYFIVLLMCGWWRYAEGNGYLVQRLAACKDEGHAQGASLWFSVAHNALRPWPWFIVALGALVLYPMVDGDAPAKAEAQLSSGKVLEVVPGHLDPATGGRVQVLEAPKGLFVEVGKQRVELQPNAKGIMEARVAAFADATGARLRLTNGLGGVVAEVPKFQMRLKDREIAYPLMMGLFLPAGLLGLVIASLLAAFMSTIDTHTNWGASYLVQDVYLRFINPKATNKQTVLVSRLCIILMGILAGLAALVINNIGEVWRFLVMLGAGLGSVSAARWYWHRVTPHAEFAAMGVTTFMAVGLLAFFTKTLFGADNALFITEIATWKQILMIAGGSLSVWIPVALWGPQNDPQRLKAFAAKVRPSGPGWKPYRDGDGDPIWPAVWRFAAGVVVVYGTLFGIGHLVFGRMLLGIGLCLAAKAGLAFIIRSAEKPEPTA
jgi:Na+/proline symporter